MVSLEVSNEEKLKQLYEKLEWRGANVTRFYEPDIDDQLTSICYVADPELIKTTKNLKLAFYGKQMDNV